MTKLILEQITAEDLIRQTANLVVEKITEILPKDSDNTERYLTANETIKLLQISLPTLNKYSKTGLIPSYRIGRSVRYKLSEVQEIVDKGLRFTKNKN